VQAAAGLILVTGKTGSGKSTTLAAMIDEINRRVKGHILTIEDPIEFVHQRQELPDQPARDRRAQPELRAALHSALREDPDVILVGELRDLETISIAVTAAEMGILVMGTLHTNGAAQTVDRIVNVLSLPTSSPMCAPCSPHPCAASSRSSCCSARPSPGRWRRSRFW
jgi:twitching motility protein PilT